MRNDRPAALARSIAFHGPLEPALDLDRPDRGPEQPRGLALEEPFEKALDRGKGSHVGGGVYQTVLIRPPFAGSSRPSRFRPAPTAGRCPDAAAHPSRIESGPSSRMGPYLRRGLAER